MRRLSRLVPGEQVRDQVVATGFECPLDDSRRDCEGSGEDVDRFAVPDR